MLKIGVIGAGHLGKIHLRCIQESDVFELVGFYDADTATAEAYAKEQGLNLFADADALIQACDVVDIVTPTLSHHCTLAKPCE